MSIVRIKQLLWTATAALLLAGVAVVVAAALAPLSATSFESSRNTAPGGESGAGPGQTPPLASFAAAWAVDLRRPLNDAPRDVASTSPVPGTNLPVRLVGTIVDPTRPRGIFVTPLGQMELRGVGEKTGGAEILRIDERSATLSIAGRAVTIKIEKMESSLPGGPDPTQPPAARSTPAPGQFR